MRSIYLHIPYCIQKCSYCDFCSVPKDGTAERYAFALCREIELQRERYAAREIDTVFFGGGTPTILPASELCRVLETLDRCFPLAKDAEVSIECNPRTASAQDLKTLHSAGFNRLSIGLQSADDPLLARIGRVHTFQDFENTFRWARQAGFENINVDVMHGLPGQTQDSYLTTLEHVGAFGAEHLSCYALILEEGTPLYGAVRSGKERLPDEDAVADMEDAGFDWLRANGYERYEVSNFAKPGKQCRHNLTYWKNEPYLGFGVAAHSSVPTDRKWYRFSNTESIASYLRSVERGKIPETERILINTFEQMFETIMLGLRLTEGISMEKFSRRFGCSLRETYPEAIEFAERCGWWNTEDPERLRLNQSGMDHLDAVLRAFRERKYWDILR